jgi:hypothetical protein
MVFDLVRLRWLLEISSTRPKDKLGRKRFVDDASLVDSKWRSAAVASFVVSTTS